jgi:hypothetical protein
VSFAFNELIRGASSPDRLSDATRRVSREDVFGNEFSPRRDDPGGILTDMGHVGEHHRGGIGPEVITKKGDLLGAHDHERGLVRLYATLDERADAANEIGLTGIEDGLMPEGLGRLGNRV